VDLEIVDHGEPVTAEPVSAPALEGGEQPRYFRYWWLAIIVFSLAGWGVVISTISLLIALVR